MITEEEAIAKGKWMVLLPRLLAMAGLFFYLFPLTLFVMARWGKDFFPPGVLQWFCLYIVVGFFIFIYLPVIYLRSRTNKWRLWAFENVRNVHLLMKMANDAKLIAPEGTLLWRLMNTSKPANEHWSGIKEKFNEPDSADDSAVPAETVIYYSKKKLFLDVLLRLPLTAALLGLLCIILFNYQSDITFVLILIAAVIIVLYSVGTVVVKMFDSKPKIILTSKGMQTISAGFQSWSAIYGEKVNVKLSGKTNTRTYYLDYSSAGGTEHLDVTNFDINWIQLERLMAVYRERSNLNY